MHMRRAAAGKLNFTAEYCMRMLTFIVHESNTDSGDRIAANRRRVTGKYLNLKSTAAVHRAHAHTCTCTHRHMHGQIGMRNPADVVNSLFSLY